MTISGTAFGVSTIICKIIGVYILFSMVTSFLAQLKGGFCTISILILIGQSSIGAGMFLEQYWAKKILVSLLAVLSIFMIVVTNHIVLNGTSINMVMVLGLLFATMYTLKEKSQ